MNLHFNYINLVRKLGSQKVNKKYIIIHKTNKIIHFA